MLLDAGYVHGFIAYLWWRALKPSFIIELDIQRFNIYWPHFVKEPPELDFIQADMMYLPIRSNSVDVVYCISVIQFLNQR